MEGLDPNTREGQFSLQGINAAVCGGVINVVAGAEESPGSEAATLVKLNDLHLGSNTELTLATWAIDINTRKLVRYLHLQAVTQRVRFSRSHFNSFVL